jgi:hypothetical protein
MHTVVQFAFADCWALTFSGITTAGEIYREAYADIDQCFDIFDLRDYQGTFGMQQDVSGGRTRTKHGSVVGLPR